MVAIVIAALDCAGEFFGSAALDCAGLYVMVMLLRIAAENFDCVCNGTNVSLCEEEEEEAVDLAAECE